MYPWNKNMKGIHLSPKSEFKRKHKIWSLDNFNDGYIDSNNRFRVYYPDHPRAEKKLGYILREIVAYEAYNGILVPSHLEVHHIDGNTLNDSKENLILLTKSQHRIAHQWNKVSRICLTCGKTFDIDNWRLKDKSRGKYCSQQCYHKGVKNDSRTKK